jgi:hypothetical protein
VQGHANRRYCSIACKDRVKSLITNYGLTVQQYRKLIAAAGGVCPICQQSTEQWHVDHDHTTGKVTGVVCNSCNIGALARTFHDPAFIRRLLDYVENPPAGPLAAQAVNPRPPQLHAMWDHSRRAGIVP